MNVIKQITAVILVFMLLATQVYAANTVPGNNVAFPQPTAPLKKAIPGTAKPDVQKVLKIAEKYYSMAVSKAKAEEKSYLTSTIIWKPDFTGKSTNNAMVTQYSNPSAFMAGYTDLKYFYLALNSAVFALDVKNPTSAGNLASSIAGFAEDLNGKPLGADLKNDKPYADDAAAVYEYALALKLAGALLDVGSMPVLLNYGYLCIDMGTLPTAKLLFETATKLAPGYLPAMEGMAAYWLAAGDKNKAQKILEQAKMPMAFSKMKKMIKEVNDTSTLVTGSDSLSAIETKLKAQSAVQPFLATDAYEDMDPAGAAKARSFVNNLAAQIKYTAPNYNYLSQFSTLQAFVSDPGFSAFDEFQSKLEEYSNNAEAANLKQEQNQDKIPMKFNILTLNPGNYANPTDVLTQQYNLSMLRRKMSGYQIYFIKLYQDKGNLDKIVDDDIEKLTLKIEELKKPMEDELDRMPSDLPQEEYDKKRNAILHKYYPKMNSLTETIWMDATNTVNSCYTQDIKPNIEAMYADCMHNVMLITDPAIRQLWEDELNAFILGNVDQAMHDVMCAYSVVNNAGGYPFNDDYVESNSQDTSEADAAKTAAENKARQDFESGNIPENSQLYKQLDNYSSSFDLLFMHAKWHPCKTEVKFDVKIPGTKTGASASITQNHMRNTVTYGGGVTVSTLGASAYNGAISAGASVSLRGEVTTDGSGNVVGGDVIASAQGSATAGWIKATGTYEASVMRGCKVSGEVAKVYNDKIIGTPEEIAIFQPAKPKKVLWKGEHQVTK